MSGTVAILMGSESDMDVMKKAEAALDEFGVGYETKVISAHRKPRELVAFIESSDASVFICGCSPGAWCPGTATTWERGTWKSNRR